MTGYQSAGVLRRSRWIHFVSVFLIQLFALNAESAAQEKYPNRPITIVAPFPPGGVADLTARPVAAAMEKVLKNPVVVVNKTGAAGAVGMSSVANSKPDG
jgi:tripartite-type tricarboxylate transporter receptor subunit TctC